MSAEAIQHIGETLSRLELKTDQIQRGVVSIDTRLQRVERTFDAADEIIAAGIAILKSKTRS